MFVYATCGASCMAAHFHMHYSDITLCSSKLAGPQKAVCTESPTVRGRRQQNGGHCNSLSSACDHERWNTLVTEHCNAMCVR